MSERGPERRDERPSFSPAATVVFAGIAAATVTMAASSAMKHARQNASGFSEVQGRVDHAPVARNESEIQNPKKGSPVIQKQMGVVSDRVNAVSNGSVVHGETMVADGGSRVSEGGNYGRNGGVRSATDRNSARAADAFVKNGTVSRLSDNSLSAVDHVLAHIGDLKSISSLKGDRLSAVVEEAVRIVGGHADDASILNGVRKAALKLEPIDAKKHSKLLNGLKMVMKEGMHYRAYDNNTVDLLPLGVTLIDRMKLDIGTEQLATLIGENLDAFRLGGKETQVRGMIRGEIGKVFEGRDKRRDAVRSGERNVLRKDSGLYVSDDDDAGTISYADVVGEPELKDFASVADRRRTSHEKRANDAYMAKMRRAFHRIAKEEASADAVEQAYIVDANKFWDKQDADRLEYGAWAKAGLDAKQDADDQAYAAWAEEVNAKKPTGVVEAGGSGKKENPVNLHALRKIARGLGQWRTPGSI